MAAKTTGKKDGQAKRPDGQLRQSQLVTTFGPGAMVDLVDRAVVIGGLEHWGYGKDGWTSLDDARLRRSLVPRLKALDQIAYVRFASIYRDFRDLDEFARELEAMQGEDGGA